MSSQQFILCTLIFIQCSRHEAGKEQEGLRCHENSWLKLFQALHPSSQQGWCTAYLSEGDVGLPLAELQRFGCGLGWSKSRSQPGIPGSPSAYSASRDS